MDSKDLIDMSINVTVLGIAQDGGRPQLGCRKSCCQEVKDEAYPAGIGIIDDNGNRHMVDASRTMVNQMEIWNQDMLDSLFITHAHLGHVDGLGLLGKEVLSTNEVPLYVSSTMGDLIEKTPSWKFLVDEKNVVLNQFQEGDQIPIGGGCIVPFSAPHRSELSDMHGFIVRGENKSLLYLPDLDDWPSLLLGFELKEWLKSLRVDIALIDGTFWSGEELPHRNLKQIPHPFVEDTLQLLGVKQDGDPDIGFIHLNHTNPLYDEHSQEAKLVNESGWFIAQQGMTFQL